MDGESAQTIVELLMRIDGKLDLLLARGGGETGAARVDRRVSQTPIDHEDRRKLIGDI